MHEGGSFLSISCCSAEECCVTAAYLLQCCCCSAALPKFICCVLPARSTALLQTRASAAATHKLRPPAHYRPVPAPAKAASSLLNTRTTPAATQLYSSLSVALPGCLCGCLAAHHLPPLPASPPHTAATAPASNLFCAETLSTAAYSSCTLLFTDLPANPC
jgi:hypothetical protein